MIFQSETLCSSAELMREAVIQIAKYSRSDIIITDEKFNIVFHNADYTADNEIVTLFDVIDELLNDSIRTKLKNFRTSNENRLYVKLLLNSSRNLGRIPIDIHFCKIRNSKDKVKGFAVIVQDAAQEIKNRIQKETFVDIISHDLKNPMRANIQILELILDNKFGIVNKDLKTVLDELLQSCRYMKYMADNLILKYKNEFEVFELNKRKYSIVKLIKDKCNKLMKILDRKRQTAEMSVIGDIPDVMIDTAEMEKVIRNLIISASNESRENAKIVIKIEADKDNVFVSFMDWGYAANKAILDSLFDEYISCANKFRKIGSGLEMFNCRKIIEAHGGAINAQNGMGLGRTITFSLPVNSDVN